MLAVRRLQFRAALSLQGSYELVGTRGVIEVPDAYLPPTKQQSIGAVANDRLLFGADSGADLFKNLKSRSPTVFGDD